MTKYFLVLSLALAACGGSATPTDLGVDQAAPADLHAKTDLAQLGCGALFGCIRQCTQSNMSTCVPACLNAASPAAQSTFGALRDCAQPACYNSDAAQPPCQDPSSTACQNCISANCASELTACNAS